MSRKKWLCLDCGVDTKDEHYFIHTPLWLKAVGSIHGMVCVEHLEERIGRKLTPKDFTKCYLNDPKKNSMSTRLRSRILGIPI